MFALPRAGRPPRGRAGDPAQPGLTPESRAGLASATVFVAAAAGLGAGGCAQDLPGTIPPDDQLHFPIGLELVSAGGEGNEDDLLIVGSSNFDQRFNAGRLFSFRVGDLIDLVPIDRDAVEFTGDFGDAIAGTVRVDSFSGDLETVTLDLDGSGPGGPELYVLSASRLRNEVTVVKIEDDGRLSCQVDGASRRAGFGCTNSHRIPLGGRDPFPVAVGDYRDQQVVAVGSLTAQIPIPGAFVTTISLMTTEYLEARLTNDLPPVAVDEDCRVTNALLPTIRGITGITALPPDDNGDAVLLTLSSRQAPNLGIARHRIRTSTTYLFEDEPLDTQTDCVGDPVIDRLDVESTQDVLLDVEVNALETRGWAISGDRSRAYVSVRFADTVDTSNAAIVVIDLTETPVRVVTELEIGEELGQPFLDERENGARLLYVGDQRGDVVYVINVTTDEPQPAGEIQSRGLRAFSDKARQVRLLDQPTQFAFVTVPRENPQTNELQNYRYAFVTNFSNSTLGVIDVTAPDPRQHRVVARLGRDLDPQGDSEGP